MSVKLLFQDLPQYCDGNGAPYSGAKLFTYASGSSTKQNTYTTSAGTIANSNPIVLDANGRVPSAVWGTVGQTYKLLLAPATDTDPPASPIWTIDNVAPINDTTQSIDQWVAGPAPTYHFSDFLFACRRPDVDVPRRQAPEDDEHKRHGVQRDYERSVRRTYHRHCRKRLRFAGLRPLRC
jgi:hypothetical protein